MQIRSTCRKYRLVILVLYNPIEESIRDFCNSLPLSKDTKLLSSSGGLRAEVRKMLSLHMASICGK